MFLSLELHRKDKSIKVTKMFAIVFFGKSAQKFDYRFRKEFIVINFDRFFTYSHS